MIHFCHTSDVEGVGLGDGSKFRGGGLHSDRHGEEDSDRVFSLAAMVARLNILIACVYPIAGVLSVMLMKKGRRT